MDALGRIQITKNYSSKYILLFWKTSGFLTSLRTEVINWQSIPLNRLKSIPLSSLQKFILWKNASISPQDIIINQHLCLVISHFTLQYNRNKDFSHSDRPFQFLLSRVHLTFVSNSLTSTTTRGKDAGPA